MNGMYHHCDERHMHRQLAEFNFRYNNSASLGVGENALTSEALKEFPVNA